MSNSKVLNLLILHILQKLDILLFYLHNSKDELENLE
jgi:hypothetical protein